MTDRRLVALLFSDIEGSTRLLDVLGDRAYSRLLGAYREILDGAIAAAGGATVDTQGDGHFASFPDASSALAAAAAIQRGLAAHDWPAGAEVRARVGVHAGEALDTDAGLVGMDIHRAARIAAAGHGGQVLATQAAYDVAAGRAPAGTSWTELGEHRFKDLSEPHRVYQLGVAGMPGDFPPIRSLSGRPHNLPVQVTALVGRDDDLAAVLDRLDRHRLVTLTGPGGAGKTRLALGAAAEVVDRFAGGVWLVELAPLADPERIAATVAEVLDVRQQASSDLMDDIAGHLKDREVLVVLDNCEHLLDGAAAFAGELLRRVPGVKVLATSRHSLGLAGEAQWPVRPLPVEVEGRAGGPAMELFAARARLVRPTFRLDEGNEAQVASICRQLDGLPLAIELAAARLRILELRQLGERLADRFRLLTGGGRSQAAHHRTLEATMDWSYELLSDTEQLLLGRLAVFVGGFTLEAAEQVAGGAPVDPADFVDLLQELVDASLLFVDGGRFDMLGTVREYARRTLPAGEETRVRRRHAGHYREYVRGGGASLMFKEQADWLERLGVEYDNLRSALAWTLVQGDADVALGLAAGMARYWYRRGHYDEARRWLNPILELEGLAAAPDLAAVLRFSTGLAADAGDVDRADELAVREAEVAAQIDDPAVQARSLNLRGGLAWRRGELRLAAGQYRAALALLRPIRDPFVPWLLINLSEVALAMGAVEEVADLADELAAWSAEAGEGDDGPDVLRVRGGLALYRDELDAADELLGRAVAGFRERQLANIEAVTLREQIIVALARDDAAGAGALLDRAMELYEAIADPVNEIDTVRLRGCQRLLVGDLIGARQDLDAALKVFVGAGRFIGVLEVLAAAAELAVREGAAERAAALLGAVAALAGRTGYVTPPAERRRSDELRAALAATLGASRLATAEAAGAAGNLDDMAAWASPAAKVPNG